MPALVIWMDSHHAKVMKITEKGVQTHPVKSHGHKHPDQPDGKHGTHQAEGKFFHELAESLKGEDQATQAWLITGPGLAGEHFKAHLQEHHQALAKHVVGVTKSDHPTDNEIIQAAQKFFAKFEQFGNP